MYYNDYNEKKAGFLTWLLYFCVAVVTFIGVVVFKIDDIVTMVFFFFFMSIIAARCCHTIFYKRDYVSRDLMKKIKRKEPLDFFDDFFMNLYISICWIFLLLSFAVTLIGTFIMFVRNGIYDNVWACTICTYWSGAIVMNMMFYVYSVGQNGNERGIPFVYVYGTTLTFIVSLLFGWWRMTPFVSEHTFVRILVALLHYVVVFAISYLIPRFGCIDDILEEFGAEGIAALKDFSLRDIIDDITGGDFSGSSGGGYSSSSGGGYSSSSGGGYSSSSGGGYSSSSGGGYSSSSATETPQTTYNNFAVFQEVETAVKKWAKGSAGFEQRKGPINIVYDRYYIKAGDTSGFDYEGWMYKSEKEAEIIISGLIIVEFGDHESMDCEDLIKRIAKGISEDILHSLEQLIKKTVEDSKYSSKIRFSLDVSKIKFRFNCRALDYWGPSVELEFKDYV